MEQNKRIQDYLFYNKLGEGAFGAVFKAENVKTKEVVAIKSISKDKLKEHGDFVLELLESELSVLALINNINVVKMVNYMESNLAFYIVLEFCNCKFFPFFICNKFLEGDFDGFWVKNGCQFLEEDALSYLKQILNGMKALHECNVIHRDLKMPNILMHNDILKIGDLGFAKQLKCKEQQVSESMGTLGHMAPEVIEFKPYGLQADMFSLGTIYYQMLFGILPFTNQDYDDFVEDVKKKILIDPVCFDFYGLEISEESKDLLRRMLQYDPKKRLKWTEIYDHPVFKQSKQNLQMIQQMNLNQFVANKVNLEQNKKIYEAMILEEVNEESRLKNIKKSKLQREKFDEKAYSKIDKKFSQLQSQFQSTYEQQTKFLRKNDELYECLQRYLKKRNKFALYAQTLDRIQRFEHSNKVNVYLPAFILAKKLQCGYLKLLDNIEKKENIYKCEYLNDLYEMELFKDLQKRLKEEFEIVNYTFKNILESCLKIFTKQNIDVALKQELSEKKTDNFKYFFKKILEKYWSELKQEYEFKNVQVMMIMLCVLSSIEEQENMNQQLLQFLQKKDQEKQKQLNILADKIFQ